MVILSILAVGAISAISARAAVGLVDAVLFAAEETTRVSEHTVCGHTFRCHTNSEYNVLAEAFIITRRLAEDVVEAANLQEEDTSPMQSFIFEGALLWGSSGLDIRSAVLATPLLREDRPLAQDVADTLIRGFGALPAKEKAVLQALHLFSV
jgi:hypothetical protein